MNFLFTCQLCCENRAWMCVVCRNDNIQHEPRLDIFIECGMWNEKERKLISKHFHTSSHISSPIHPTSSHEVTKHPSPPPPSAHSRKMRKPFELLLWREWRLELHSQFSYCCACLHSFTRSLYPSSHFTNPNSILTLLHMHTQQQLDGDEHRLFVIVNLLEAIFDPFFFFLTFSQPHFISSSSSRIYFKFLSRGTYMKIEIEADEMRLGWMWAGSQAVRASWKMK